MSEIVLDPTITVYSTIIEALATCLCAQIKDDGLDEPCYCGVMPGFEVAWDIGECDDGSCGIAYVRLGNVYPSSQVGVATVNPGNCAIGTGLDIEMGMLRCFELNEDGSPSSPAQLLEASRIQYADILVMQKALVCCEWLPAEDFVVGTYQPVGPSGGVVGGAFPLSAWIA